MRKLVPWLGGKRALARRIAASLPPHTCYAEPFSGGASVFFAKPPSTVEVLNDKHLGLVNLFRVVQRHPETLAEDIRAIHDRLRGVVLECLDFEAILRRYDRPHTLFYCDPPYYGLTGYGPRLPFGREDHERLAVLLKAVKGRFILSINDDPLIRDLYAWARTERATVRYTVGRKKTGKTSAELAIRNFKARKGRR